MSTSEREYLRRLYKELMAERTNPARFAGLRIADKEALKNKMTGEIMILEKLMHRWKVPIPTKKEYATY